MKNPKPFLHAIAVGVCLSLFNPDTAYSAMFDSFDSDEINSDLWMIEIKGVGPAISQRNGRVEALVPATSTGASGGEFGAAYFSNELFSGDFDFQIDFDCPTWPRGNGVRLGISIAPWFVTARVSNVYGANMQEAYVLGHYQGLTVLDTTDQRGSLRMTREGATLTGYYWHPDHGWVLIGSGTGPTAAVRFGFGVWSSSGHFTGQEVKVHFDNFEARLISPYQEPPTVVLGDSPSGSYIDCINGRPIDVEFGAVHQTQPITALSATVNGEPVALMTSGIGTKVAAATGTFVAPGIGVYTLTARASSAAGTGYADEIFTVDYDLTWLPPVSLGKPFRGGSTVPLKFSIRDCQGRFVRDDSVRVVIHEVSTHGEVLQLVGTLGVGAQSVRVDDRDGHYIINFPTARGARQYRADVSFGAVTDAETGYMLQGSTVFSAR
jgi:hypothetical protein